jgi:hypothetical protein
MIEEIPNTSMEHGPRAGADIFCATFIWFTDELYVAAVYEVYWLFT